MWVSWMPSQTLDRKQHAHEYGQPYFLGWVKIKAICSGIKYQVRFHSEIVSFPALHIQTTILGRANNEGARHTATPLCTDSNKQKEIVCNSCSMSVYLYIH